MELPAVNLNAVCSGGIALLAGILLLLWNRASVVLAYAPRATKAASQSRAVPLLGCLEAIVNGVSAKKAFAWTRICGPVTRFRTGRFETVVLNDLETIKAFLNHTDLLHRSPSWILNGTVELVHGGKTWAESRRYSTYLLRILGSGKTSMENIVTERYRHLENSIAEKIPQPVDLSELLLSSICGIMCRLLFGCCCALDDPRHRDLTQALRYEFTSSHSGSMVSSLPPSLLALTRCVPFTKARGLLKATERIQEFVSEHIRPVARDLLTGNSSFVKLALLESQNPEENNSTCIPTDLIGNTTALLIGGTASVSAMLMRLLLRIAANVDTMQARTQGEIDVVTKRERQPTWEDRYSMPYTMAVIWESHRLHTLLRLGLPRWAIQNVMIGRHFVGKGSTVVSNVWAVHNNPEHWTEPEKFDPARFLNGDGSLASERLKKVVPFSVGKRMCPGQALTAVEIYIFLTCTLQKFSVLPQPGWQFDENISDADVMQPGRHMFFCIPRA